MDPDIPRFDVNPGVRNLFVANFIEGFAPDVLARDVNGVLFCLQDTFRVLVGISPVLDKAVTAPCAQCSWPSETMISNCSSIHGTKIY